MSILKIGHRGAKGYYKDNTSRSIIHAVDMNVDLIEVDVALTEDNIFVLWHDNFVKTFFMEKEKEICDVRYRDLIIEDICTLNKGLWLMGDSLPYLDLKIPESKKDDIEYIRDYADRLLTFLEEEGQQMILLASFNKILMDYLNKKDKCHNYFLGYLYNNGEPVEQEHWDNNFELYIFDYRDEKLEEYVKRVEGTGGVFVYTVNEEEDIERMRSLGVKGIVCDYPDRLEKIK